MSPNQAVGLTRDSGRQTVEYGSRTSLVLKADIRPGHTGELTGKVERLEKAINDGDR